MRRVELDGEGGGRVARYKGDCRGCGGLEVHGSLMAIVVGSGWLGRVGRLSRMREVDDAR